MKTKFNLLSQSLESFVNLRADRASVKFITLIFDQGSERAFGLPQELDGVLLDSA